MRLRHLPVAAVLLSSLLLAAASPTRQHIGSTAAAADQFVTRTGSQLVLGGVPWRVAGVNMYWLGLDENVTDSLGPTYPTHDAVDRGFDAAVAVGARLVRSTTLGVSVGSPRTLEPRLGVFDDRAFAAIDYAVASARRHGVRLMIPLSDEWHYYDGGKHTFTNWLGHRDIPGQSSATSQVQRARENTFYTDRSVIGAFRTYVARLLNHVNPRTGLRLGSDPTIAIWETGNELYDAPKSWTQATAAYVKTLAPRSLVADGSAASGKDIADTGFAGHDVDIVDGHFYPTDTARASRDADYVAARGKAYLVGEYPLDGSSVSSFLSALAANRHVAGGLAWALLPTLGDGRPEPREDRYTFHVPGATPREKTMVVCQRRYADQVAALG